MAVLREEKTSKQRDKEDREKRQRDLEKKDRDRKDRMERKAVDGSALQLPSLAVLPGASKKEKDKSFHKGKSVKKPQVETLKLKRSSDISGDRASSSKTTLASAPVTNAAPIKKRGWETTPAPVSVLPLSNGPNSLNTTRNSSDNGISKVNQTTAPSKSLTKQSQPPASVPVPTLTPAVTNTAQVLAIIQQPQTVSAPGVSSTQYQDSATVSSSVEDQLEDMATGMVDFLGFDAPHNGFGNMPQQTDAGKVEMNGAIEGTLDINSAHLPASILAGEISQQRISPPATRLQDSSVQYTPALVELPSVSLFRQEKLSEVLRRCALSRSSASSPSEPLSMVDEHTLRTVIYRWIVRASHGASPFLDPVIPSWTDNDMLAAFFQRQLISESRRGVMGNSGAGMVSIEVLKEAGSLLAILCQALAKELADFRGKCEQQVPPDWSDSTINVTANEVMSNDGQSTVVVIDWAGRSHAYVPSLTFTKLRNRYQGVPNRLLTAVFATAKRYETEKVIISGTRMEYRLPGVLLNTLAGEASVSIELWTNPLTVFGNNAFCGVFPDVDASFGGLQPFGKENGGGEGAIIEHGGSVVVMPPLESSTAALYMRNILDSLERADGNRIPLSYIMFLPVECFTGTMSSPSISNLPSLDPRLGDRHGIFVRFVETLPAGQHIYACDERDGVDISQTGSLFVVLQNEAGKVRFPLSEISIRNILRFMTMGFVSVSDHGPPGPAAVGFPDLAPEGGQGDFASLGGTVIPNNYGSEPKRCSRRGRLFELVDDGEDDNGNDVDVMSGMLNNLNVSMFQNNSQDVDIEAISLMGIGGPALRNSAPGRTIGRFG